MNINLVSLILKPGEGEKIARLIVRNLDYVSSSTSIAQLSESIRQSQNWIATDSEGNIGALVRFIVKADEIYVLDLHVFEGKELGKGSSVIQKIFSLAEILQKKYVRLRCKFGSRACNFYRHHGFEIVGQDNGFLRLELKLNPTNS